MTDPRLFGKYLGEVVLKAKEVMKDRDIPYFLQYKNKPLNNSSPIETIWHYGSTGRDQVLALLEEVKNGFAV